ncbi:unnamed protein product [Acanthoscelides obtectus]|uniref:Fe2OG dioxygenase domain-containing protein n=1 Tax=Acanthoscelides obtectus TaxID=200917 RepID=A0A9P0JU29_ACAOB|nr:unnamed protein product [Acanthoscelides obtectus]CAK1621946.1 Procollagen-lysine,2-oxoglutarate 5-dioxygenase 3 [Acanthoscelides obtectus]
MCSLFFLVILSAILACDCLTKDDVLVYTVATEETDGYLRYMDSAKEFGIKPNILGFGQEWKGGKEIRTKPGGGWKINLLKEALQKHKDESDKVVLFTDAYDVIFSNNLDEILKNFKATGAKVLFGAEPFCWPNPELAPMYPEVKDGKRFLNSGLYMGYVPELLKLLYRKSIGDDEDDQLYFTEAYLDETFRESIKMKLDHTSTLFQNLNGATSEIEIYVNESKDKKIPEKYVVKNYFTHTEPMVIHGNGFSKLTLNYLGNYVPNMWNSLEGCIKCKERTLNLANQPVKAMPLVYMAIFIEVNTPFLEEGLQKVYNLDYPKERMHLFIHNAAKYHTSLVKNFTEKYASEYLSFKQILAEDGTPEWTARDLSLDQSTAKNVDWYFSLDSIVHLDNPQTLRLLIEQNRSVVAPLLVRSGKAWSNFWGALTKDGFYARSKDYLEIVYNKKRGLWNVPFITNAYLVRASIIKRYDRSILTYNKPDTDPDMAFCRTFRELNIFLYVSNRVDFGHLINADNFDVTLAEPEMYQIFDNEMDWEARYIHEDYQNNFAPGRVDKQPCPDVYWFPIVSLRFCNSLISMMESYGKWSAGTSYDERLEGGYEAVPTRDIHMNQVGWEPHWLKFLQKYVRPLQEKVFLGYIHDPPRALMNFVVRYRPDEQPFLKPHHDSSTYTINIALNQVGVDYEGGGCKFIRYNCSVVDTVPGWILMHPGRLTHWHEGLYVTKGTRYIMIAFVDP